MTPEQDDFLPTRRSLLSRLKDWDDQESWRDFFNTYWKLIYSAAIKAGLTDAEAQEVVQETIITVAKKMKAFKYDPSLGSFKGWLLNTTRWRIADQLRLRQQAAQPNERRAPATTSTDAIERIPGDAGIDLDAVWEEEWQKNLMDAALHRVKRQVSPQQYQLFDLYVFKNWSVRKIAKTLGVSASQVYLAKHRISNLLKKEIKNLEDKFL
ncbi:MAG: RNA polymerase sigma factor [Verrucomicrobiia bacterium]